MTSKRGFQLQYCARKCRRVESIPKASDVVEGRWLSPPDHVSQKVGDGSTWLIGVDIETHDWEVSRGNKGNTGQFGFYNLCAQSDFESRVCQLGWAFGAPGQPEVKKEYLVKPDGWVISDKAFKTHKITLAQADAYGRPLAEILAEFCTDAKAVADRGGRLVLYLIPADAPLLENHHSAGTDAQLHRKLGYALYGLAVAPCRMEGSNHEFLEVTHTQRATGARKCSRCSEWFSQSSQ